jgi:hypothetical protein
MRRERGFFVLGEWDFGERSCWGGGGGVGKGTEDRRQRVIYSIINCNFSSHLHGLKPTVAVLHVNGILQLRDNNFYTFSN